MNVAQKSQSIIMFYLKSQSKWILGKKANQLDVSIKEPININVYKKNQIIIMLDVRSDAIWKLI